MRSIKFRAWDKRNEQMIQNVGFQYGDTGRTVLLEQVMVPPDESDKDYHYGIPGEYAELMQYTSLKDKNGKEIYEGDIVKSFNLSSEGKICKIVWNDINAFWLEQSDETSTGLIGICEVIGNIHENPELLK